MGSSINPSRSTPRTVWDHSKSCVVLFGGNIRGTVEISFDFGTDPSDALKHRVCFFVLDMFRKRGVRGLTSFYGTDRLRSFRDAIPEVAVGTAKQTFAAPSKWTEESVSNFARDWLATRPEFSRPDGTFGQILEACAAFMADTGQGVLSAYTDIQQLPAEGSRPVELVVQCRPAILLGDYALALLATPRRNGFKVFNAPEINAQPWGILQPKSQPEPRETAQAVG